MGLLGITNTTGSSKVSFVAVEFLKLTILCSYTSWVNLVDYSSLVVPVIYSDKDIDKPIADFKPLSEIDRKIQNSCRLHVHFTVLIKKR